MVALVLVITSIVPRVVALEVPIEIFFRLGCLIVGRTLHYGNQRAQDPIGLGFHQANHSHIDVLPAEEYQ